MKNWIYILIPFILFIQAATGQNCDAYTATCNDRITVDIETGGSFVLFPEDISALVIPDSCKAVTPMMIEITDRDQNVIYQKADSVVLDCEDIERDLIAVLHMTNSWSVTTTCWGEIKVRDRAANCKNFGPDTIPLVFNRNDSGRISTGQLVVRHNGSVLTEFEDGIFILKKSDVTSGTNTLSFDDSNGQIFGTVSTFDLIVGLRNFFRDSYTPIKNMVMDVDGSASMSVGDLIVMQEYILAIRNDLNGQHFLVLPDKGRIPAGFDKFDFGFDPSVLEFGGDTVDELDFVFDVFSMGDISGAPDSLSDGRLQTRQGAEAWLEFEDRFVKAGERVEVSVIARLSDESVLQGFQFAVENGPWQSFTAKNSEGLSGWMTNEASDELRISYASLLELREVPFTLTAIPARSGYLSDLLRLSTTFHREAVSEHLQVLPIELAPRTGSSPEVIVSPNPFDDVLRISLPDAGPTVLELLDLTGRALSRWQSAGSEELRLDLPELPSGVYILRLEQAGQQKLIRLIRS